MKRFLLVAVGVLFIQSVFSQIPAGYYDDASGLSGDGLKSALHNIVDDHTEKSYDDLWNILRESDEDPDNSDNFILIYTGRSLAKTESYPAWNREHVWAKSHGDFGTTPPAGSDAHHLRPCDVSVNSDRGNKDFDNGGTQHSEATECYWDSDSWEPRDAVKGDVARMIFYMAVRYEGDVSGEPDLEIVDYVNSSPNKEPLHGKLSVLLQWHIDDPVDDFERNRNEVVYSYQNNRNPFIDSSQFVARIWGGAVLNNPPVISNVENNPVNPTSSDAVSVSATITDSDGNITNAELHWGLSSGSLTSTIAMSVSLGDTYTSNSDIPAQIDGTTVYYEIQATDDSSDVTTTSENTYIVDDNPSVTILSEDFTTCPASGWTTYNVAGSKNWECGTNYMQVNAYDSDVACDDWLISPAIDLNSYSNEMFTFISWTKYNDAYYPSIEVKYSTDYSGSGDPSSATWISLSATWSAENSEEWTGSGDIDLSSTTGSQVYIAFHYTSSGTGGGTSAWWEIDDILIIGDASSSNIAPEISGISIDPTSPTEEEDVTVSATITDSDGTITTANIKWGTSTGNYTNTVSMTNSGDAYSGIIPAQAGGTTVYYIIEATDDEPETTQSGENNFAFSTIGNVLPEISDVSFAPTDPESTESVTVSATIIDSDGTITTANIKWGTSTGNYTNTVSMTNSGDDYTGAIPAQADEVHVYFVIYTVDNDGGSAQSSENDYVVDDPNVLPEISDVSFTPTDPESTESVTVSATIIDSDGTIASATIKWGTTSGNYNNNVTMSADNDVYSGMTPALSDGTHVYFVIYTVDNDGGLAQSSENDYVVDDPNILPEISDVGFTPTDPESTESVGVSATITDSDGTITTANIKWGTSTGNYTNTVSITNSGDNYTGAISAQADGTEVFFVIEAEDNEAGVTLSSELNYTVEDPENQAPVISDVILDPSNPIEDENPIVSCVADDTDGAIESVVLKWKRGTGDYTDVNMNFSGGRYYGQIPKQSTGETIYFSIIAEDNEGLQSNYEGSYEISESNSINDLENRNLKIYPNPTRNNINIEFTEPGFINSIKIYNLIGKKMLEMSNLNAAKYTIELNRFPKGMYIIQVNDSENSIVRKVMLK
ncbi:MAG: endonuclease [Bacteroidales bacterium]|nr:endonuclease [Bacteroidales bacterium]